MPRNQHNNNRNRTLLIILGIVLAFLLSLNARSFYTSYSLIPKKEVEEVTAPDKLKGKFLEHGTGVLKVIAEKFSSLKK